MLKYLLILSLLLNTGWHTKTSEHFIIHYQSEDRPIIRDLLYLLEDEHDRLIEIFETELIRPVDVYLHPDRNSLVQAVGMENASRWLIGVAINDTKIHLISPLNPPGNHTEETVKEGLIHELVHICVASATVSPLPLWLNEGLAVYFAKQRQFIREVPGVLRNRFRIPTLRELNVRESFESERGYALSYTILEFIVKRYGHEALSAFVQNYPDYEQLGVMSEMQLESQWQDYLRDNYINLPPLQRWMDYRDNIFDAIFQPVEVRDFAKLSFMTQEDGAFSMIVLDAWGELIQVMFQRPLKRGYHEFRIDASNYAAGTYYMELRLANKIQLIRFTRD